MRKKLRSKLTYANVMATIAVFAALGMGGAYAAVKLKPSSVKTKTIKNSAVTTAKIADSAVTTAKIADNAVTGAKADEVTFGNPLVRDVVAGTDDVATGTGTLQVFPQCPAGTRVISGGASIGSEDGVIDHAISRSIKDSSEGWFAQSETLPVTGGDNDSYSLTGTVLCAKY